MIKTYTDAIILQWKWSALLQGIAPKHGSDFIRLEQKLESHKKYAKIKIYVVL